MRAPGLAALATALLLAGCALPPTAPQGLGPTEARAAILRVLPAGLADRAGDELGVPDERLVAIRPGEFFDHAGLTVHALGNPGSEQPRRVQYVLAADAATIYVAGDVQPRPGQAEDGAVLSPTLALLPISGRGAALQGLGLPGSMTPIEAARLAHELGVRVVVPQHYDMFSLHQADPCAFSEFCREHYSQLKVRILEPGARWIYPS